MSTIINTDFTENIFNDFHPSPTQSESDYDFTVSPPKEDNGHMDPKVISSMAICNTVDKKQKAQKKFYQWNTKNKSFIELHNDLKKLGIENNKFFLVLYDKELMDVDPYSLVVPIEMQIRIVRECIRNPWYFIREICRIPEDGKPITPGGGTIFKADRNNIATWYLFLLGIDHYSSKPRQRGKTQDALTKINYVYHFGSMSSSITFSNKDLTLNKMNLMRLKTQRDLLPLYLQMKNSIDIDSRKIEKETSNVLSMKNPITKNSIVLLPTASTAAKAQGIGRGYTAAVQLWDEFDWTPHNVEIIYASVFAFRTASDNARKNKSLFGRIFTSTPGNMDTRDGQEAEKFINGDSESGKKGMLKWTDSMFDMPIEKLRATVMSKSYNGIVFVEHSWQQLKCSNEWYELACKGVNYDPEQIAREILLKRLRGSSKSPFKRTDIMFLLNNVESPVDNVDYSDNCAPIYFYEKMNRSYPYLIGIDPAEGLSGDNMAMVVVNPYTEKTVAEFKSPHTNQTKMAKMVVKFMDKFCPKALLIIENNRGRELINRLRETHYSDHLWYDVDKLEKKESVNTKELNFDAERAIGWNTSTKTRPMIFGTLETLVTEEPDKVNTRMVVDDVCSLEKNPTTGTIKAANGKHDDVVMAFGIVHTVFRTATNLDEWGIIRGSIAPDLIDRENPESKMKILKQLFDILPDDLKASLGITEMNKDPVQEFEDNHMEIRKAEALYNLKEASKNLLDDEEIETDPYDNATVDALDDEFFNVNTMNQNNKFDIGDFL